MQYSRRTNIDSKSEQLTYHSNPLTNFMKTHKNIEEFANKYDPCVREITGRLPKNTPK